MSDDDRRPPSPAPIDWRRSAAPVFRAGPLPTGERLDPIPTPPRPRPAPPSAPQRPVNLFRDSLVPVAPRTPTAPEAQKATEPRLVPKSDATVRPLPAPAAAPPVEASTAPAPLSSTLPPGREREGVAVPTFATPARRAGPSRPLIVGGALAAVLAVGVGVWALAPRRAETPAAASQPSVLLMTAPAAPVEAVPIDATPAPIDPAAPEPAPTRTPAPAVAASPRTETATPEPRQVVTPVAEAPPAPAIDAAPLVQPPDSAASDGPPPPTEPTPRTQGDTIVTGPR